MIFPKKLSVPAAVLLLSILATCKFTTRGGVGGDGTRDGDGRDGNEPEYSYINFHAQYSDGTPAIVEVSLYEEFGDAQLLLGGTLPTGDFFSPIRYRTDVIYEVYLHYIPTHQCLNDVLVAFGSNTPWPRSQQFTAEKTVSAGPKNPMNNLAGCRP